VIVVDQMGRRLRCTCCEGFRKIGLTPLKAAKRGFAEFHSDCVNYADPKVARAALAEKSRRALRLQLSHRQSVIPQ
jgi:hypothetical protein